MNRPWEVVQFVPYLRSRWRIPVIACGIAVTLTLGVSMLLPKRYTARVVISIDPPDGNDVRMATAVSPVYLESLKGYERLAASDSLFARAVDKLHLKKTNPFEPIETLKRRVLHISKIRETRILEISATLPDAGAAHALAQYIAQETVAMNQAESAATDRDRAGKVERQLAEARLRLNNVWNEPAARWTTSAIDALQSRNDVAVELLGKLRLELADAKADAAEYSNDSARAEALKAETAQLEREIATNQAMIDSASSRRERAEAERNVAQSEYAAVSNRLMDVQAASGSTGERLRIIDPGIVPQRPSYPNPVLNAALAMTAAATGSLIYVALGFSYEKRRLHEALFR